MFYVLLDFSFNQPESPEYRFAVPALSLNEPVLLKSGNLSIIVARFDSGLEIFKQSSSRLDQQGYLVAYAYGTQLGCPVSIEKDHIKESCSSAVYDLSGRSLDPRSYKDLEQPDHYWNKNFTALTIYQE